jgi:hypothetical protein
MLCKYAPATEMVGDRPSNGLYGASRRHLQMGRCRRGGSLLRSVLARRRKDRHSRTLGCRSIGSAQRNRADRTSSKDCAGQTQLHRLYNYLAGARTNLFRRRCRGRALESQPFAAARSIHHVAFERQAAGFPADRRIISSAAPGSRHLRACRHHHRSGNGRISDQQQCDLLRASALGAIAAVASAQVALKSQRPDAQLVG